MARPSLAEILQSRIQNADFNQEALLAEVRREVLRLELSREQAFTNRAGESASPEAAYLLFRSNERRINTINLLQYLAVFLDGLPGHGEVTAGPVNPFRQCIGFTKALISELGDTDVQRAILRELRLRGKLTDANRRLFHLRIMQLHRELDAFLKTVTLPETGSYRELFRCLQRYYRFWFSIHDQDQSRIRKADKLIFQLSTLLLELNGGL